MLKKTVGGFASLLLSLSLVACGGGGGQPAAQSGSGEASGSQGTGNGAKELVVVDWGGAFTDAHKKSTFDPFEQKYGVKITVVSPPDYGKLKAMVESGNVEVDVANVDFDFSIRGGQQGLLEKLDFDVIKTDGIDPKLINDYGVGAELFSAVIAYNTDTFSAENHPKSWADFWDTKKFPGPRSMWKYPTGTLEAALLADGVKPEELYPLDVDRALKSLDKIKKDVKVWWTTGAQVPQLLANGEVVLAEAWNGRITTAKGQGAPEDVDFSQGLILSNVWIVPKGTKNKELAMKFIAFAADPQQQAAFSSIIDYAPTTSKAIDLLPEEVRKRLGQSAENAQSQIYVDYKWWVENFDAVNERFEQWLLQ
ncbi:ABC transporter substrate-binding protein [Brevibacillus sp. B_LB10_24]|uniref:ABC transporter substrate-binding protein n=1 Tax=Brevibacillus sp. B_LB10_24 TaxID=3380645 RepID=UPI0038B84BD1